MDFKVWWRPLIFEYLIKHLHGSWEPKYLKIWAQTTWILSYLGKKSSDLIFEDKRIRKYEMSSYFPLCVFKICLINLKPKKQWWKYKLHIATYWPVLRNRVRRNARGLAFWIKYLVNGGCLLWSIWLRAEAELCRSVSAYGWVDVCVSLPRWGHILGSAWKSWQAGAQALELYTYTLTQLSFFKLFL